MAEVLKSPQNLLLVGLQRRFCLHTRGSGKLELLCRLETVTRAPVNTMASGKWLKALLFIFLIIIFFFCIVLVPSKVNSVVEQVLVTQAAKWLYANG